MDLRPRRHNISEQTFYGWKHRFRDIEVYGANRVRELEQENARLKRMAQDPAFDKQMLGQLVGTSW